MDKSPDAFRTISEVAEALDTPAHVLRFWETRFPQIRPVKRAGGRRYYRPSDLALLAGIKRLLHDEGMTIRGVQKILREQGVRHVADLSEEATAEEEALISAMTTRHEAEVTRLTPREANQASVDALEQEAREQAMRLDEASGREAGEVPEAGTLPPEVTAEVIAFPVETPQELVLELFPRTAASDTSRKDTLPATDPRQSMFPGFGPQNDPDSLTEPLDSDGQPPVNRRDFSESTHQDHHEEAPFVFDIEDEAGAAQESAVIAPFPARPEAPAVPPVEPRAERGLAARLRALPPGTLSAQSVRPLSQRIRALRQRLDLAQKQPG